MCQPQHLHFTKNGMTLMDIQMKVIAMIMAVMRVRVTRASDFALGLAQIVCWNEQGSKGALYFGHALNGKFH